MKSIHPYFLLFLLIAFYQGQGIAQDADHWYYNVDEDKVFLDGYDVVAYHLEGEAILGKAEFGVTKNGIHYYFASAKNKRLFRSNPSTYHPAYGGWCTMLMGFDKALFPPTRSKPDPTNFTIIDDQLYLFGKSLRQDFKQFFHEQDSTVVLARADSFWTSREALAAKSPEGLPEGMNPDARMELLDWMPFMSNWSCELTWWADTTGVNTIEYSGKWYFHYGYYGYCIQDDYVGDEDGNFSGTINGPAIRGYDPVNEEWHMTFIPVNQSRDATWLMRGKFVKDGVLEGFMDTKDPYGNAILQKIRLEVQGEDAFTWSAHWSYDGGETWLENVGFATCTKIKV